MLEKTFDDKSTLIHLMAWELEPMLTYNGCTYVSMLRSKLIRVYFFIYQTAIMCSTVTGEE